MERLTNRREADLQRRSYETRLKQGYPRSIPEERFLRLAAYEDTGLEPDMIEATINGQITLQKALEKYTQAEEQGRLVVLPCKVGDKLYDKSGKVAEVEEFWVDKRNVSAQVHFQCDYDCNDCAFNSWHTEHSGENSCDGEYGNAMVPVDDFGKTVFLTREEAERAMEGRRDG